METREFVRALPKAELHLHFEGAVPWGMVRSRSAEPLPERPMWWADDFRFDDFDHFRRAVQTCLRCLTDLGAYEAAAASIFGDLKSQNVRYVEISFDVMRVVEQGLPLADVVATVKRDAPPGLRVLVFGGFSYHKAERTPTWLINGVLTTPGLDGIDLHGDETRQSTARFVAAFDEARRRGLVTKAHAGELAGPDSIAKALDLLGVRRIEHGVRAIEDERILARLAAEAVTLDLCPWSNVKLRVISDRAAHPIGRLHERGVRVTVSTDDPTVFGRSLSQEIASLVDDHGLTLADVARFQANAFEAAHMPAADRDGILAEIDALTVAARDSLRQATHGVRVIRPRSGIQSGRRHAMSEPAAPQSLVAQLVETMRALAGPHPGFRPAHAKGIVCTGTFRPSPDARRVTRAPHLQGDPVPTVVRFSNGSGNPEVHDGQPGVRALAVKFQLRDGKAADILANSIEGFPARTPEEFLEFLRAQLPDRATGQPVPDAVPKFLGSHPAAAAFVGRLMQKPVPASYAQASYHAEHAFLFTAADGSRRFGRYHFVPDAGEALLSPRTGAGATRTSCATSWRAACAPGPSPSACSFRSPPRAIRPTTPPRYGRRTARAWTWGPWRSRASRRRARRTSAAWSSTRPTGRTASSCRATPSCSCGPRPTRSPMSGAAGGSERTISGPGQLLLPPVIRRHELLPRAVVAQHARGEDPVVVAPELDGVPVPRHLPVARHGGAVRFECEHPSRRVQRAVVHPEVRHHRADPRAPGSITASDSYVHSPTSLCSHRCSFCGSAFIIAGSPCRVWSGPKSAMALVGRGPEIEVATGPASVAKTRTPAGSAAPPPARGAAGR